MSSLMDESSVSSGATSGVSSGATSGVTSGAISGVSSGSGGFGGASLELPVLSVLSFV